MLTPNRRTTLAAGLALVATPVLIPGAAWAAPGIALPDDMSIGAANAPVRMVEYASLTCPHCAEFHAAVFPTLKSKYIDTGRVRYTIKEMLTAPQQVAAAGFLMARCAGSARYFNVVDGVFRSQSRWQGANIKPIFVEVAKQNGLTEAQFDACLADATALRNLQLRVKRAAEQDGINSTPTIYINGKPLGGDHVPTLAQVEAAIAAATPRRR